MYDYASQLLNLEFNTKFKRQINVKATKIDKTGVVEHEHSTPLNRIKKTNDAVNPIRCCRRFPIYQNSGPTKRKRKLALRKNLETETPLTIREKIFFYLWPLNS